MKLLSWLSLAWMTVEGAVAIGAGILAGSIALIGFGLDSAIEGLASVIIIWRFTGSRAFSALVTSEVAEVSWVGTGLAVGSVIFMPMLGIAKQRLADQLGSAATAGEGRQNMLCAYLAGALLVGLLGNALVGAWWLDTIVGLLIAAVAGREGLEAWREEGCCVSAGRLPLLSARAGRHGPIASRVPCSGAVSGPDPTMAAPGVECREACHAGPTGRKPW